QKAGRDDLDYLNPPAAATASRELGNTSGELARLVASLRERVEDGDSFVSVPIPSVAASDPRSAQAAAAAYQQEREIVDTRLVRKVTVAEKGVPFGELCRKLSGITGIALTANRRVSEDKITVFCRERPLRDVMRQISALFGFTWLRSGTEGAYEYEL